MTDTKALEGAIKESGIKKGFIAEYVGLSRQGLANKMTNKTSFTADEIIKLSELLHFSETEIFKYFFA